MFLRKEGIVLKKPLVLGLLLCIGGLSLWGEVSFSSLHLSKGNKLLFQAVSERPGEESFATLFLGDLNTGSLQQLTFFPEDIQYLPQTGQLQIQNRYGLFRTDPQFSSISPIKQFPSFNSLGWIHTGKIYPTQASPDGRYLLYIEPLSPAYGKLILLDLTAEQSLIVSPKVELTLSGPLVRWAPDSKFFIYGKTGRLYYFSIEQFLQKRVMDESMRYLGEGNMESVRWGTRGDLFYISGTLVYRILGVELFARTLYQPLIQIGHIVGKIPFGFNPNFDQFWIAPGGDKLLLNVEGRNIFVYPLKTEDFHDADVPRALPYLLLPRNATIKTLLWSKEDVVTLLTGGIDSGVEVSSIYRIDLKAEATSFTKTSDRGIQNMVLSPDGNQVALLTDSSLSIRNYTSWKEERTIPFETPIHVVWVDAKKIVVGGFWVTMLYSLEENKEQFICFSQPQNFGFQDRSLVVQARGNLRAYDLNSNQWKALEAFKPDPPSLVSEEYRVFLEPLPSGPFKNIVMVRNLKILGTYPLFKPISEPYDPLPEKEEPVDFTNFSNGSRMRGRVISLVFNAVDSVEGLTEILQTLSNYKIKATFFINGEFIRRNPDAVQEIAQSGHEVGSLFYTHFDLTDPQYRITREFIKQGLARNEDEYFQVTGKELSLLWHTPYYVVRDDIISAAKEMNYTYIGRDVDSLDWAVKRTDAGLNPLYFPAADLIERIIQLKKPGSIISFQVGKPENGSKGNWRDDYLFHRLDLLINRLLEKGYRMVPVSHLMDLSR
jgi:peptidoglycan/xylan/chitin deacetylase (PgdA/CDA1 family)